jgi:hypothetical protein
MKRRGVTPHLLLSKQSDTQPAFANDKETEGASLIGLPKFKVLSPA